MFCRSRSNIFSTRRVGYRPGLDSRRIKDASLGLSGARNSKASWFEAGEGGSLFLDELGDLRLSDCP